VPGGDGAALRLPFHQSGEAGWVLLVLLVAGWDIAAPETMSEAFRRMTGTPAGRVALTVGWGVLTLHLFNVMQDKDPLNLLVGAVHRKVRAPRG
jgi:hypothetical protein